MRKLSFVVLVASVTACGAPEGDGLSPWAVRLTNASPSASQAQVIADRIGSIDPLDAAWGAYLAGDLGLTSMADALVGLTQDGPLLRGAALDALARVGGSMPDARLRELMPADPMTAMAVALQEPAAHRDLIFDAFVTAHDTLPETVGDMLASSDLATWRAYANALGWLRDREFAATLLASLETSIDVEVVSPGDFIAGFGCRCGGAFGSSCHGFGYQPFTALPPVGTWSIREANDDACVVLLPGPTDVCLARVEGRFQESVRERALGGLPLRHWVSSIGHDAALAAVDDYGEDDGELLEPQAPEEVEAVDENDFDGAGEPESPSPETREACPADATIADGKLDAVESPLNDELLAYLSALQGESLRFDGRLSVRHVWTGEEAYRAQVASLRDRIRAAHDTLGRALADAYLLPDGYHAMAPSIQVFATDERTCGATSTLPRL